MTAPAAALRLAVGDRVWYVADDGYAHPAVVLRPSGPGSFWLTLDAPPLPPEVDAPAASVVASCTAELFGATRLDQAAMCEADATWTDEFGDHWCPQHCPPPDDQPADLADWWDGDGA